MEREELREKVLSLIENKQSKQLKELFETTPEIDIAEALSDVEDVKILLFLIRVIGSEHSADLFAELTQEQQENIINAFTDKELLNMLENSFADDIVDSLEDMPANLASRVLTVAPKELRKDINTLLNYEDDTAGSVMTTEYLSFLNTDKVKDVISSIREKGKDAETVYTLFIRDNKRTIVGTVNLDDLIFAQDNQTMDDIMSRDFIVCHVNDDQEAIANKFKRYDLHAMAVVNRENKIIGIITVDDIIDVIVEEANEDIAHLSNVGTVEDGYLKTPIWKLLLKCVPWIIALMILQIFSTMILSKFDQALASFIVLSVFTPLIMDAGGNSGGQTTTIIVRAMALDEFQRGDFKKVVWKEFRLSLLIALIIGLFAFGWLMFEMSVGIVTLDATLAKYPTLDKIQVELIVSTLVACTLFITMVVSRLVGCILPFIAKLFKRDPAVMCGPLTTTCVDIISLVAYFLLWTNCFAPVLGL